ncbi:hypothetical protein WBS46_29135, partial [Bacillus albus]
SRNSKEDKNDKTNLPLIFAFLFVHFRNSHRFFDNSGYYFLFFHHSIVMLFLYFEQYWSFDVTETVILPFL